MRVFEQSMLDKGFKRRPDLLHQLQNLGDNGAQPPPSAKRTCSNDEERGGKTQMKVGTEEMEDEGLELRLYEMLPCHPQLQYE